MAELESNLARERPYRDAAGGLRGDKLGLVSTDEERLWPPAARILLVIGVGVGAGAAGWFLVSSLPGLLNDLFGLVLDLLLGAGN